MPYREVRVGPLRLTMKVSREGAGAYLGLGGPSWATVYEKLADREAVRPSAASATAARTASDDVAVEPGEKSATSVQQRIAGVGWYHTLDLGSGVRTDGLFDHAPHLARYGLPADLSGLRVLDIGAFDGFWALEFERRGAAEVVAFDAPCIGALDFPPGVRAAMEPEILTRPVSAGFPLALDILGSRVERRFGSVYEMAPEALGVFDLTHLGNVLVHLRDPALALARMASVTAGEAWIVEAYEPEFGEDGAVMRYMGGQQDCNWWRFSAPALLAMARDAGFDDVMEVARFAIPFRNSRRDMYMLVIRARGKASLPQPGVAPQTQPLEEGAHAP